MKVLVPIDIVHPAKTTIDQLSALVPLKDAEVLLLYVKEEWPSYERVMGASGDFKDDWENQIEKKAKAAFAETSDYLKNKCASVNTEIVVGPPAMMIETVARDEKFDLTVVTPGRHSQVEMFFLGSVSSSVVKHGPETVLLSRPSTNGHEGKARHVIMGIDGSPQSHHAIKRACELFALQDNAVKVTLVHIVSVADALKMVSPVEYISMVENNLLMEGETFLADGKRLLSEAGVEQVSCVLKEGDPASEIIKLANSLPADLIVIGAQGRTAVQHFLLGSVSHRIAMHAPCSTAVVKTPRS